jgi:hypothetical protein
MSYPDEFVSDKEKQTDDYKKSRMDYFANIGYVQYSKKRDTIGRNYDLLKGILHPEDFYDEPEVKSFANQLSKDVEMPANVKHYPILNPPLNTLIGELSNRPDTARVKAMDSESQSERLESMTEIVQQFILQETKAEILAKHAQQTGEELSEEELDQLTMEQVQDYLTNYTSTAEKWANRVLTSCKVEFNLKEVSEEMMRDLLICSREYVHVYEDNSKTGFGIEVVNPKNFFGIHMDNNKYTSDNTGTGKGTPMCGIVRVMDIAEIIERFNLTKKEIDHLRDTGDQPDSMSVESSFNAKVGGINSVKYPQYSPLLELERTILESQLAEENNDDISNVLGISSSVTTFGNKFVVVQAYWISKKEIYEVTYIDAEGKMQTMLVDESYKTIPNEISIKKGYINQWMKGHKIGPHIYDAQPLKILDYCPIIGVTHEAKNTQARSIVDLMKPLQTIYNICMNQLFRLMEKEWGMFIEFPIRKVITPKDGDNQDALDIMEEQARIRGLVYTDESVENTKVPVSNTSVTKVHDATRTNEIMSRINIAQAIKNECWELVGITRQRLGGTSGATETATATQSGLSQSFTQTEHLFTQHQYILNQLYQAIVDAAQYTALQKPTSTISYLSDSGDEAFLQVNSGDLSMRDLKVFITSRAEDAKIFQKLQELGDTIIQNGGDAYDVFVLYETSSVRQKKDLLLKLKKERQQLAQQQQQIEQQKLEQQQQQFQAQMQLEAENQRILMANENNEHALDRVNKKEVAIINTFSKQEDNTKDSNMSGVPDILEVSRLNHDIVSANRDYQTSILELQAKNDVEKNKLLLEQQKLQVERENMKNDLEISKIQAASKAKAAKSKPKPKKK